MFILDLYLVDTYLKLFLPSFMIDVICSSNDNVLTYSKDFVQAVGVVRQLVVNSSRYSCGDKFKEFTVSSVDGQNISNRVNCKIQ